MNSALLLQIQHKHITMTLFFLQVIQVKILPRATVYTKNTTLEETLPPGTLPRNWGTNRNGQRMIKGSYFKFTPFGGNSTYFIFTTSSQPNRVQKIKERGDQIYLSIMHLKTSKYKSLTKKLKNPKTQHHAHPKKKKKKKKKKSL